MLNLLINLYARTLVFFGFAKRCRAANYNFAHYSPLYPGGYFNLKKRGVQKTLDVPATAKAIYGIFF